jgi:hypothetical protein
MDDHERVINQLPAKFEIKHRFTAEVLFSVKLPRNMKGEAESIKLGFAARAAVKARADLSGANLTRADLSWTNLTGADLSGADLTRANLTRTVVINAGQRSDGYWFHGWVSDGVLKIRAGCHNFSLADARAHWTAKRGGTALGAETMAILDHIETVAKARGMI